MSVTKGLDTSIFDKRPKFMRIFLVTSLIGILLISLAVYRASRELEVIHQVDNMYRVTHAMLGEENLAPHSKGLFERHPVATVDWTALELLRFD